MTQSSLNKFSSRITQPKSQGASQAMLYGTGMTEADMDKADAPLSEQISAPAAEAASDSAGEQTDDQSLERDSE